ncbi:MAG: UDP-3-O-acyl-N-acetylglucosamine deacetylase, partial [Armatimonadota bacterium]|nr:UDP-3-O-acyl-N-acetylglucosamine deacetylase [Armatimonadota bacterium]
MENNLFSLQTTLRASFELSGIGVHSGRPAAVKVLPAEGGGIRFRRTDQAGVVIPAHAAAVASTPRSTVLQRHGVSIATTEHLLAALWSMGVDHAEVVAASEELPILDGSAQDYARAIQGVGLRRLSEPRRPLALSAPAWVRAGEAHILALPAPRLRVCYVLEYSHPMVGTQVVDFDVSP